MKKILPILFAIIATSAAAQHRPYPHHGHGGHGWGWVVPALVGGAVVYGMTRPAPPPPAVVYVPQGYPPPPAGFHYEQLLDAHCNCYRWVLVQG